MNHCLTKPFKKKDLVPLLDAWLPGAGKDTETGQSAPSPDGAAVVFDFDKALDAFMDRKDVLTDVLTGFLDTMADQLSRLGEALQRSDFEAVRGGAHAIKGGAWNLNARSLGEAARVLEEAAGEEDDGRCSAALATLREETERFRRAAAPYISRVMPTGQ
jgi:HPt (histidine-containing phosphotransfer) domain-containing protein